MIAWWGLTPYQTPYLTKRLKQLLLFCVLPPNRRSKKQGLRLQTRVILMQNIQFFHYQFLRAAEAFLRLLQSRDWSRITLPQFTSSDWLIRIWLNTEWRFAKINTNAPFAAGKTRVVSLKSFIWESSRLLITAKADFPNSNVSVVHSDWLQLVLFRIRTCFLWRRLVSSTRRISVLAKANKENAAKNREEKSA